MDYDAAKKRAVRMLDKNGYRELDACANCEHATRDYEGDVTCDLVSVIWSEGKDCGGTMEADVEPNGICDKHSPRTPKKEPK